MEIPIKACAARMGIAMTYNSGSNHIWQQWYWSVTHVVCSHGTFKWFTTLDIGYRHYNLEWSIQHRMNLDLHFWHWTKNQGNCVFLFFAEYSEGCYLLRQASNYIKYYPHTWFWLHWVLFGFAGVYCGYDRRFVWGQVERREDMWLCFMCVFEIESSNNWFHVCCFSFWGYRVFWIKARYGRYIFCWLRSEYPLFVFN